MPHNNSTFRVWATRPTKQNTAWQKRLESAGYEVFACPFLEIKPLKDQAVIEQTKQKILNLDLYKKLIFVSQNAVNFGFEWIEDYWPQLPLGIDFFAVGAATAKALRSREVTVIENSVAMNSQALLELDLLREVEGEKILIFRGQGGLTVLGDTLLNRGALVEYCELYQRAAPDGLVETLRSQDNQAHPQEIIPIFSGEALKNFEKGALLAGLNCYDRRIIVPGERVAKLANAAGFKDVTVAINASEDAMFNCLVNFI